MSSATNRIKSVRTSVLDLAYEEHGPAGGDAVVLLYYHAIWPTSRAGPRLGRQFDDTTYGQTAISFDNPPRPHCLPRWTCRAEGTQETDPARSALGGHNRAGGSRRKRWRTIPPSSAPSPFPRQIGWHRVASPAKPGSPGCDDERQRRNAVTDHSWSDHRIALESLVIKSLDTLPGHP